MLNALLIFLRSGDPDGRLRALKSFGRQGFVLAGSFDWGGGMLDTLAHPSQSHTENCSVRTASGLACCVGPVWYRGHFGVAALHELIIDISLSGRYDEIELRGNFALFIHTADHTLLLNDSMGLVRLYVSADGSFYSTSWLATCAYLGCPELDNAAALEYVLLGAVHSERTVAHGVSVLPLARIFDLKRKCLKERFPNGMASASEDCTSFDLATDAVEAHLREVFAEITGAFPERVNSALSGGFDSRLIVAGLLACGTPPKLFVYGGPKSKDVSIAQIVAGAAEIPISVINKEVLNAALAPLDLECLERSALFFDGLPNDGIYDPGADRQTRLEQNLDGTIALNGGGGEIFRNFFHLPDRDFDVGDVVRTFYRGFDPVVFRNPLGLNTFEERLGESILNSQRLAGLGADKVLNRRQVELAYPLFRCHHWMSVNNSVAVRHGYYATPLIDLQTVRMTWSLPLKWKNAGKFESCLIAGLDCTVAKQISSHGFRLSDGPSLPARLGEWLTCARPIVMRPYINALRRRLHKIRVPPEMLRHCRTLLPGEWRMDPLLELRLLPDNNALARALAVEVVWRRLFT